MRARSAWAVTLGVALAAAAAGAQHRDGGAASVDASEPRRHRSSSATDAGVSASATTTASASGSSRRERSSSATDAGVSASASATTTASGSGSGRRERTSSVDAGTGASETAARRGRETPDASATTAAQADAATRRRDPCHEVLRAAQFEDVPGAERAWAACRQRIAAPGRVPVADDLRTLEDAAEALQGLRRRDGAYCVAPAAPFDLSGAIGSARDTRACLQALDRFITSEEAVARYLVEEPYAAGRLAQRAGVDVTGLRRSARRRAAMSERADGETVALARLVGRHFMRACRCMGGAQPDSPGAVRAMRLPTGVESVLLRGLAERGATEASP
ncbi:MAG: hypothetical protein R3A52_08370 [Polyangiales bacterium]